ncbi:sugar transferase [Dyadobacter alkalitolerans]|uniref:sugar transferase n=1 Tax=Dyadobacter alkalitolerans TaxID=492736 RepID=UPI0004174482|nr:sugar transferase [Dyadobacter alkalitolerans]
MTTNFTNETAESYTQEQVYEVHQRNRISITEPADGLIRNLELLAPLEHWLYATQKELANAQLLHPAEHLVLDGFLLRTPDLNQLFKQVQVTLLEDQYFAFQVVTAENVKAELLKAYSSFIFKCYYLFYFFGRRVLPKLKGFRKIGRLLGVPVDMSKAEVVGRLIYSGFRIVKIRETGKATIFIAKRHPSFNPSLSVAASSEGVLFSMTRNGKNGEPITVYKFRSMHPYAEFAQAYLHETNGLAACGKFKDDFRISTGGRIIRKYWIDELPMLYNLIKGDIKLVGVRPLSDQYLSLYPETLRTFRAQFRPGLLPPFYSDLPKCFDEILSSELAYLEAYQQAPLRTDLTYFFRIVTNIFIRHARSK